MSVIVQEKEQTMFGIHDYGMFLAAGILLNLTPGQDTFYILGRTLAQGKRAGVASVLGIACGSVLHTIAAAAGLSALLFASASAFLFVKLAGAVYLVYLGLRMLLAKKAESSPSDGGTGPRLPLRRVFFQGLLTNLLNPKVALFFLALMPQFISEDSPAKSAAFVLLGFSFIATGTFWCLCLVWFSAFLGGRFRRASAGAAFLERAAGALFVLLGLRLATAKR